MLRLFHTKTINHIDLAIIRLSFMQYRNKLLVTSNCSCNYTNALMIIHATILYIGLPEGSPVKSVVCLQLSNQHQ